MFINRPTKSNIYQTWVWVWQRTCLNISRGFQVRKLIIYAPDGIECRKKTLKMCEKNVNPKRREIFERRLRKRLRTLQRVYFPMLPF